eukprot:1188022-Prorocentrum_minimum.AAC.2
MRLLRAVLLEFAAVGDGVPEPLVHAGGRGGGGRGGGGLRSSPARPAIEPAQNQRAERERVEHNGEHNPDIWCLLTNGMPPLGVY